jgi:hypothetical protein
MTHDWLMDLTRFEAGHPQCRLEATFHVVEGRKYVAIVHTFQTCLGRAQGAEFIKNHPHLHRYMYGVFMYGP